MSNVIKSFQYIPVETLKKLELAQVYQTTETHEEEEAVQEQHLEPQIDREAEKLRDEILSDAKEFAEKQVRGAAEEAERLLQEAQEQIAVWWQEKREQDEQLIESIKAEGFQQGYEEGQRLAAAEWQARSDKMMGEAQEVLLHAYEVKEQLILEAEPFLVDLSCGIAEKVIDKQLSIEPEYMIELIRKNLARKREQGTITLCVAPAHFAFVNAAREELALTVDSQAELQIIPDGSVKDRGVVIRSAFGSVDARIDTQLAEIKKELLRVALDSEEQRHEGV
ncbi:FliH/SctL family protein [Paenibacillus sp. P96]|uniref:FliH/SctL family protein n=1 Tax=Paenibacillus zeirhizosphaerae TaxID=2987519 RepID=A0ABT9FS31_9BACL|nr:FliH/SctL family protein [Paenibacillus sp. P96]MDP4097544.1 FliH/SctL family protein [Paenibacillus sp. P96]